MNATDLTSKLRSLFYAWIPSLNPEQVRIWSKLNASLGRCFHSSLVMIKALAGSWNVPRKEHGRLCILLGELFSSGERQVSILLNFCCIGIDGGLRCIFCLKVLNNRCRSNVSTCEGFMITENRQNFSGEHTFVKCNKFVFFHPFGFELIDLQSGHAFHLHRLKCFGQRLTFFGNTEDKLVISHIDSTA